MKKFLAILFVLFLMAAIGIFSYLNKNAYIINGFAAKKACGCHFYGNKTLDHISKTDLSGFPLSLAKVKIDNSNSTVESSVLNFWSSKVIFDNELGCVLKSKDEPIQDVKQSDVQSEDFEFPMNIDKSGTFNDLQSFAFEPEHKTRALLIIKNDTMIYEHYDDGYTKDDPQMGWSMNKSISNALVGILIHEGALSLEQNNLFGEWTDERSKITVNDLLQMQTGLEWEEEYAGDADATRLLFKEYSCSDYALNKKLEFTVGENWEYSSGTTNIISKLIRDVLAEQGRSHIEFLDTALLSKIDMESYRIDTDQAGNQIYSSFGYATPRDWAKFGRLYLHDGIWNGERLLPEKWIDYTKSVAKNSEGQYGAQFWLNRNHSKFKDAPEDLYYCSGYEGQYVFIIPSKNLLIVRLGLVSNPEFDVNEMLKLAIGAL